MLCEIIYHFHLKKFSSSKILPKDPRIYQVILDILGLGRLPLPHTPIAPYISASITPIAQDSSYLWFSICLYL